MYDLNQPNDVIAMMRDAEMTNEQIMTVCKSVTQAIEYITNEEL